MLFYTLCCQQEVGPQVDSQDGKGKKKTLSKVKSEMPAKRAEAARKRRVQTEKDAGVIETQGGQGRGEIEANGKVD